MDAIVQKVQESWKAIVAFVAPLVVAAVYGLLDEAVNTVQLNAEVWVTSAVAAVAVYLKRNEPPA